MQQMTWRIVGDVQIERRAGYGLRRAIAGNQLTHVANTAGEILRACVCQLAPIFLHPGATAGAVDDDRLIARAEGGDVCSSECACLVDEAGMHVQRSTADLCRRLADGVAIDGQRADGGLVNVGEEALHDAAPKDLDGKRRDGTVRDGKRFALTITVSYRPIPSLTVCFRSSQHS